MDGDIRTINANAVGKLTKARQAETTMAYRVQSIEAGATRIAIFPRSNGRIQLSADQLEILKVQFNHCISTSTVDTAFVLQLKGNCFLSPANAESLFQYFNCHQDVDTIFTRRSDCKDVVLKTCFDLELSFVLPPGSGRFFFSPPPAVNKQEVETATTETSMETTTKLKKLSKQEKAELRERARVAMGATNEEESEGEEAPSVVEANYHGGEFEGNVSLLTSPVLLEAPGAINPQRDSVMVFLTDPSGSGNRKSDGDNHRESCGTEFTFEMVADDATAYTFETMD